MHNICSHLCMKIFVSVEVEKYKKRISVNCSDAWMKSKCSKQRRLLVSALTSNNWKPRDNSQSSNFNSQYFKFKTISTNINTV